MNKQTIRRIHSLEDHCALLKEVFESAKKQILIVSPFVSLQAVTSDKIPELIIAAVKRGVEVAVHTDRALNQEADGTMKINALAGIEVIAKAGAKIFVFDGIHNKTLIRDNNLIAEGSFNWLSAVRKPGGTQQREERTLVVEGPDADEMIKQEISKNNLLERGAEYEQRKCIPPKKIFLRTIKIAACESLLIWAFLHFFHRNELGYSVLFATAAGVIGIYFITSALEFICTIFSREEALIKVTEPGLPTKTDHYGYLPGVRDFDGTYINTYKPKSHD